MKAAPGALNPTSSEAAIALVVALALAGGTADAAPPPPSMHGPTRLNSVAVVDTARRVDANRINMFVTNVGSFAWDLSTGNPGLFYPKGKGTTLAFAGGLWIGGLVGGQLRLAVAEYTQEFGPGAMFGSTFDDPFRPEYVVYKVKPQWRGDPADTARVLRSAAELATDPHLDPLLHHSWSDYMRGAAPYGAPTTLHRLPDPSSPGDSVDVPGPAVFGNQMVWTVFNDANPSWHSNSAGKTPLGIEARLTGFAYERADGLSDVVFLRYQMVHKGIQTVDSAFMSFWLDPDVGLGADDLVGCDTTLDLGYAYNAPGIDGVYGTAVPAIGVQLLQGPTPSGGPLPPLPMTSFNRYIGGTDPASPSEFYNLMKGLGPDGTPRVDPTTGLPTRFMQPGDPVSGTGWLDANPADRRFLVSSGPFNMVPGDTQDVWVAIIAGAGTDAISSVYRLVCLAEQIRAGFLSGGFGPILCPVTAPVVRNCPRPESFWREACGGSGVNAGQLATIAGCVDQRSVFFNWGLASRDSLCALLASTATDPASEVQRALAVLLANRCAAELGIVPVDGQAVFVDSTSAVICGRDTTLGRLTAPATLRQGLLDAQYINGNTANRRALEGAGQGLDFFRGGADVAADVPGSSLNPTSSPDSFSNVELRFLATPSARAYQFLRLEVDDGSGDGPAPPQGRGYLYAGYRPVAVEAWDLDSGRELELAFVERTLTDAAGTILPRTSQPATFDSTWSPDASALGGREQLMVVRREYSTAGRVPEIGHDGAPADGATPLLYTLWARRRTPTDLIDPGDAFRFRWGYLGPGADALLLNLGSSAAADSMTTVDLRSLVSCLRELSEGLGLPLVCAPSVLPSATVLGSEAEPNRVRITWAATGPFTAAWVQRCGPSGCSLVGTATADGSGRVSFEDEHTGVQPGQSYTYSLGLLTQGRLYFSGDIAITTPLTAALRVIGVAPNPAPARLRVIFLLGSDAPARLALHDITGRKVFTQDITFPVTGRQTLEVDPPTGLPAGMYFVRVEQRGAGAARKVVIIR